MKRQPTPASALPLAGNSSAGARAPDPAAELALREVLSFPLRLLPELPLATTLVCVPDEHVSAPPAAEPSPARIPSPPALVVLTCSGEARALCAELGVLCLAGEELRALAVGVEQDRAGWPDLGRWAERKRKRPGHQLTAAVLFAGVYEPVRAAGWPVNRVLGRLGLRLTAVATGAQEGCAAVQAAVGEERANAQEREIA